MSIQRMYVHTHTHCTHTYRHLFVCVYTFIAKLHPNRLGSRLRYNSWNCVPFADVDGITLSTCLMRSAPSLKTRLSRSPIRSPSRYREVSSPTRQRNDRRWRCVLRCCDSGDSQCRPPLFAEQVNAARTTFPCLQEYVYGVPLVSCIWEVHAFF